jgi:hypothetical protein
MMADLNETELREVLRKSLDGARQRAVESGGASIPPETWDLILDAEAFLAGRWTLIKGDGLIVLQKLVEGLKQYAVG